MEKLIELAVEEYLQRVDGEPVIDSKIAGDVIQEFGFNSCREFQAALDDRVLSIRTQALDK